MRTVLVIGIGAGDPEQVTVQAVNALNRADVFFVVDKGAEKRDLLDLRQEILARYAAGRRYRVATIPDPPRDRTAAAYDAAVEDWRRRRAGLYEDAIAQLGEDECGAFLVWGDPGLYDGTIEILDAVRRRGAVDFVCQVIPGISSIQALAARHGISLSRSGRPLHITTGRRLADGLPAGADDVVVMLDANCAFREAAEPGTRIYWGAYVGTPYELLAEGDLPDAGPDIEAARDRARSERGWMMDSYLLRRNPRDPEPDREAAASDEAPAADPVVVLSPWSGPWPDGDPDANFKADVALYSNADPLDTLRTLSANTGIPLGALVRYVLARWASAGSESLLYAGPSVVERMWGEFRKADEEDSDEARRRAYEAVRQMVAWLRLPLS